MSNDTAVYYQRGLAFLLLAMLLPGCQMLQEREQMNRFDESVKHYAAALRWGHENTAIGYVRMRDADAAPAGGMAFNDNIRVTEYTIKTIDFSADKKEAIVTARLGYFATDSGVVQVTTDQQLWWFDEQSERWFMDGKIPEAILK